MVTPIELAILALAIIALIVAFKVLKHIPALVVNAVLGVVVLLIANAAGMGVNITIWAVLVCAIAGVPGAIIVLLLSYLDIAFMLFPLLL